MEHYYQLFMKVIVKEIKKFQLDTEVYSTYLNELTSSFDQNFDVPYNRCAYMYKYGVNNTHFFKDCVDQFLLDKQNAKDILSEWKSHRELNVCSLSIGPALDYLAFVLAILEYDPLPPNFTGAKIISQHGAWRNTIHFLLEALNEQGSILDITQSKLKFESVNIIQADFSTYFSGKFTMPSLSDVHIVLMVRTLNLKTSGSPQEGHLLQMLKVLISSLRSNATIFCVDTKPSIALFTQVFLNFPGRFLYGPLDRKTTPAVDFPVVYGTRPTISGRGVFFVWQKLAPNISTSHFIGASGSTDCESDLKVASVSGDDISVSKPCSIGDDLKIEAKESVDLPWIELKTFWKNSSLQTKKLLKELMHMDKEKLENIESFILQSEKVDNERNVPVNIKTETLDCAELSFPQKSTLQTVSKLESMITDCSNTLVTDSSFNDSFRSFSIGTVSSANSPIYEKSTSPDTIEVNSSVLLSSEKESNYSVPTKIDPIKIKSDSEEHTAREAIAAATSLNEKAVLTKFYESPSSTSIKELTDYIRQLASSLESMTKQNASTGYKICNGSLNNSHSQHPFVPNNIYNAPSCSKYSSTSGSKEKNNSSPCDCEVKKKTIQCTDCYLRCHCCHNRCTLKQHNCHSSCCYCKPCSQPVSRCIFPCSGLYNERNVEDTTSPNIVIPLQNKSEDVLLKIVNVLKSDCK